jgi:UDP-N-acetylmuramoyl-tripeptide--D-alanyl-D-alanine ligase
LKGYFKSTAAEIAGITGGILSTGKGDAAVDTVTTDSRELDKNNLFIPLAGEKFDGHNFLEDLIRGKKINCALAEKSGFEKTAGENGVALIQCSNSLAALGKIGEFHRDSMSPLMVGITGTNGKTTTKELVHAVLSSKYKTHRNHKNYNNEIGVPFTLLNIEKSHEAAVIEMGMNHKGEIERLSKMVKPHIGIITSIGAGHLEFLESVEGVAYAKSEIIKGMGKGSTLILNRETECFHIVSDLCEDAGIKLVTFGMNSDADIYPESYSPGINSLEVVYKGKKITAPLYGRHNAFNLMAAIALGEIAGITPPEYASALAGFKNVGGRSDVIDKGYYIIDDTYNSNPLSSLFAVDSVCEVFPENRKIAVLSDMKELGESSGLYHVKIGEITASRKFDVIVLYGEMAHLYMKGALNMGFPEDKIFIFDEKEKIATFLKGMLQQGDVVLVKGSRSMKMEDVVKSLKG